MKVSIRTIRAIVTLSHMIITTDNQELINVWTPSVYYEIEIRLSKDDVIFNLWLWWRRREDI